MQPQLIDGRSRATWFGDFVHRSPNDNLGTHSFKLLKSGVLCDGAVRVGDRRVPVHRLVLVYAYPFFETAFTGAGQWSERKSGEVVLREPVTEAVLDDLIRFAYTGAVHITADSAEDLFRAAHFLDSFDLCQLCIQFMSTNLTQDRVLSVMALAETYQLDGLRRSCGEYVARDWQHYIVDPAFKTLEFRQVWTLLGTLFELELPLKSCVDALTLWSRHEPAARCMDHIGLYMELKRMANQRPPPSTSMNDPASRGECGTCQYCLWRIQTGGPTPQQRRFLVTRPEHVPPMQSFCYWPPRPVLPTNAHFRRLMIRTHSQS